MASTCTPEIALPEGSAALAQASSQARAAGVEQAIDLFWGTVPAAAGEGKCFENKSLYIYTPKTKEEYMYRDLFSKHFPSPAAAGTVPQNKSIACSTPAALAWDEAWANAADPSGRAISGVHVDAYNAK